MTLAVRRSLATAGASEDLTVRLQPDTVCDYGAVAVKEDALNEWADGNQVVVTTAMMRVAETHNEPPFILAHEIAHNAQRHIDAESTNVGIGALFALIVDVAFASQGINTNGEFTRSGMNNGASANSQDFECEADNVGMYILARSQRPFDQVANFWRWTAQEVPDSIKYASHPPASVERFVRLDQIATEIRAKAATGEDMLPTTKRPP